MAVTRDMVGSKASWRFLAAPILLALIPALILAGCSASNITGDSPVALTRPVKEPETAAEREHARILAAYGGAYRDEKLKTDLEQTVDKLVAASERPDLKYQVTILNSPSVNAFALPSGNLYVTRGLIALANDNSELASVLAHEMSHVIAISLPFGDFDLLGTGRLDPGAPALLDIPPNPNIAACKLL